MHRMRPQRPLLAIGGLASLPFAYEAATTRYWQGVLIQIFIPAIYALSYAIPATHFLEILRGVVLRGADLTDLMPSVQALAIVTFVVLAIAVARFKKQLA